MRRTLVLAMVLVNICSARIMVVQSRTLDRPSKGFKESGYAWPKTILWHGLRSSPGSLWFFYSFLLLAISCSLVVLFPSLKVNGIEGEEWAQIEINKLMATVKKYMVAIQGFSLSAGLLYLGLSVTKLSDVMEAYLAGMVATQVILSTPRIPDSGIARVWTMNTFVLSAVLGIAMLDSYHTLNLLNTVYSVVNIPMNIMLCSSEHFQFRTRSFFDMLLGFIQMAFSIEAYVLASRVEGTHLGPMRAILATACVYLGLVPLIMLSADNEPQL